MYHRKANERGVTKTSWLEGRHSFSFNRYYDEKHLGFGNLLVINDDIISPRSGFGEHGHDNMEIVTYIISGELSHADSLGNKYSIKAGEAQRMSAGTGIRHSEFNNTDEFVHLLQIWFFPKMQQQKPSYEQKMFSREDKKNQLKLIVSENGDDSSLKIGNDISIFASVLEANKTLEFEGNSRDIWVQIAKGNLQINEVTLAEGDGLGIKKAGLLNIKALAETEFLIFSM